MSFLASLSKAASRVWGFRLGMCLSVCSVALFALPLAAEQVVPLIDVAAGCANALVPEFGDVAPTCAWGLVQEQQGLHADLRSRVGATLWSTNMVAVRGLLPAAP
jgi:hypothetical protein